MPKKIGNCFDKNLTFEKLMKAHYRARKHKMYKKDIILYEMNLEHNIINLKNSIKNNTYKVGKYREFKVYDPKERVIKSLPYVDRIVHQWYIEEFVKPYIIPRFIDSSFACMENKGTHKAVELLQKYIRIYKRNFGDFWILKCDIKKFFYNIDPNILLNIMKKYIRDKKLIKFTELLIFSGRTPNENVGIPIGNYTSQYFANIYLNELDQYVKRVLKIKYYIRYMDDFIILLRTKKECINIKNKISSFLRENLKLELNSKSRYYPYKMGVNFCGYRTFTTHRLLRNSSKKKIIRKVKKWNNLNKNNLLDIQFCLQSLNSWIGHVSHCNSYHLVNKVFNNCNFLYNNSFKQEIEKELINDIENNKLENINKKA